MRDEDEGEVTAPRLLDAPNVSAVYDGILQRNAEHTV